MELRQLRYFVEIADRASFSRAAETLSIAQPALTSQIQKLEAEFGAPLFVRTNRGIVLTDVGTIVLAEARKTLDAADATRRVAAIAAASAHARIVLAYTPIFPFFQTARVIRNLRRDQPNIHVELREMWSAEQFPALHLGAIDLAFVQHTDTTADEGLVRIPLAEEVLTVVVPSAHPLALKRSVTIAELIDEPFIISGTGMRETARDFVFRAFADLGASPRIVQEVPDIRILLGLVYAGLGISILSSAARGFKIRGVSYVSLMPRTVLRFDVLFRRNFGGRALAPFLERLHDYALGYGPGT